MLPKGTACVALGLISMRPEDNTLAWLHTWRVFERIAQRCSAGPTVHLTKLKNFSLPADQQLKTLAAGTMKAFAGSVLKGNFDDFYADSSSHFKVQMTAAKLYQTFRGFTAFRELDGLSQHTPVLEEGACLDKDGLLKLNGHCPTHPQATTFRLTYMWEQTEWKLLGIHVAMKKMPAAAVSDPSTPMNQSGPPKADHLNVLAAENGGRVVLCSSQYNQTTWGAENLIDGQLGSGHGYANQHNKPVEIVFTLSAAETLTQLCFNPYTVFNKFKDLSDFAGLPWEHTDLFFDRVTSQGDFRERVFEGGALNGGGRERLEVSGRLIRSLEPVGLVVTTKKQFPICICLHKP